MFHNYRLVLIDDMAVLCRVDYENSTPVTFSPVNEIVMEHCSDTTSADVRSILLEMIMGTHRPILMPMDFRPPE